MPYRRKRVTRSKFRRAPRWLAAALLLLAACLVTAGLIWTALPAPDGGIDSRRAAAQSAAVTPLYLDGAFGPPFAGEMIAQARGLFAAEGARIGLQPLPADAALFERVVADRAIGVTTGHKFLLASWQGKPVTAFAASFLDTAASIVAPERSGIRAPRDLLGKRLGYRSGAEEVIVYDAMMAQLGLPRSSVRLMAGADLFGALRRGELDAVITSRRELSGQTGDSTEKFTVIKPQDYGIHIPGLVYFASSDLVRDRPSVIRRALQAIIRGWQEVYSDPEAAAAVVAGFEPGRLSAAVVRTALDQQRDLVRPVGMRIAEYDQSRWNTLRDILLFAKLGTETVALPAAITYDFLRDVYRRSPELDSSGMNVTRPD